MRALPTRSVIFTVIIITVKIWAQPPDFEDEENGDGPNFLDPDHLDEEADSFVRNGIEYIFVNSKLPFHIAELMCNENYQAKLAFVKDLDLADFLAEAFSETNLIMDALWLGAKKEYDAKDWNWIRGSDREVINPDIVKQFVVNEEVDANDRICLTFSRKDHDRPHFRPLSCTVRRAALCERPYSGSDDVNSTHLGWIKLDDRYYKIFNERVDWDTAFGRCFYHDHDSTLAVVTTTTHVQQLGRYLLIGRPSLENAWIDGKFINGSYRFEQEKIILANESDQTGFPPWRNLRISKTGGCVLLDRHLGNTTYFVEARCERFRPYICYKVAQSGDEAFTDIIIGKHGYRLHYSKKNWFAARDYCKIHYGNYSAYLAEVREKVQLCQLLYVMGENRTAVRHIWLGGKYHDEETPAIWRWESDNEMISTGDDSFLKWVQNKTYQHSIEKDYICLKMDRENHIVAINYGSLCVAEYCFICLFTDEELRRLQIDEMMSPNIINND